MTKLPVVAAITNYNMAKELSSLLPQVVNQGYADIFVLDDASTDNSREVVQGFSGVTFVAGKTNKGAGANRNRIIDALHYKAIVHFLDADVVLETNNTARLVQQTVPDEAFGFIGGLVNTPAGMQSVWNYGPGVGLRSDIGAQIQALLIQPLLARHPQAAARLRRWFKGLLADWPDPLTPPARRTVNWCSEANMVVRSDIFARLGGFDKNLRETEILELAMRMHQQNLPCYFDPIVSVRHTEGQVRNYNRNALKMKELFKIARQFGLLHWLVSNGKPKTAHRPDKAPSYE